MPTADATLLPPPPAADSLDERGSARRLDEIGVEAVLEAMIDQKKRASQPAALELEADDDRDERAPVRPSGTAPRRRDSAAFLKAR